MHDINFRRYQLETSRYFGIAKHFKDSVLQRRDDADNTRAARS